MNTRKYPRTMQEAFGPYASRHLEPMRQPPMDWQDRVVLAGCAVAAVAVAALMIIEWFA